MFARILILFCFAVSFSSSCFAWSKGGGGPVAVRGYVKSNGTYVAPHYRSAPDSSVSNNWSTVGNVNPYTGEAGTKNPTPARGRLAGSSDGAAGPTVATPDPVWEIPGEPSDPAHPKAAGPDGRAKAHPLAINAVKKARMASTMSAEENSSMEMACIVAKLQGPANYRTCKKQQVDAFTAGVPRPDLALLNAVERQSIETACIVAKAQGPATLNQCLVDQLTSSKDAPAYPRLNHLSASHRQSIETACIVAKSQGPASLNVCLTSQLAALAQSPTPPSMAGLSSTERQSLDTACIVAKSNGPAQLNACLSAQLAAFAKGPKAPSLNGLSSSERQSLNMACIAAKSNGPALYNQCLHDQMQALNVSSHVR
jgi:hypothetical protein